jgi:hypothetical protein
MRKQDRIAAEQQNRSPQHTDTKEHRDMMKEREQVKGSASQNQPTRPPRQPGKLPLPD